MFDDFLKLAQELHAGDQPFALATVVRCEAPTSGKPGDRAIVSAQGKITGWIGGGCAQPIVIQEALKSIRDGKPRLVRVSPSTGAEPADGITGYTMMCHSGGTLDIFIEPVLAKPHFMIFGRSPVAVTLAGLARVISYRISVIAPQESRDDFPSIDSFRDALSESEIKVTPNTCVVVATQGEDDEGALLQALKLQAPYVAFVASRKKWEAVSSYLRQQGMDDLVLNKIRVPAGLNIGAVSPEEIAVSILAEAIQFWRKTPVAELPKIPTLQPAQGKDPVCGMMVHIATARYISLHEGKSVYFCCAHCKDSFDADPSQFASVSG